MWTYIALYLHPFNYFPASRKPPLLSNQSWANMNTTEERVDGAKLDAEMDVNVATEVVEDCPLPPIGAGYVCVYFFPLEMSHPPLYVNWKGLVTMTLCLHNS